MEDNLQRILNKRTDFEELTQEFNMPEGSHIDTIDWFLENGHRSNSLRNGFVRAKEFATDIREYYNECKTENAASRQYF
tara:strand:+ start:341 stop:577 length:237 start_codon:yes stop_codon:yes gene_type:complete